MEKRRISDKLTRIVVKVGTRVLTCGDYRIDKSWIKELVAQIALLLERNIEVILVTSGAIGAGMGMLKAKTRPKLLPQQQACAAIGQSQLMKIYDTLFREHGLLTAQILLTAEDLGNRKRYLNAKNTLLTLLGYKNVVPIINENDTVSVDEIKFGDNDRLSAQVATLTHADLLIILSNVDGLYDTRPSKSQHKLLKKCVISRVDKIDCEIEKVATKSLDSIGTGGMATKVQAAKMCGTSGIACIVGNGREKNILLKIVEGQDVGTLFVPKSEKLEAKKRWIGFSTKLKGEVFVDEGAKQALTVSKKSLLAKGIVKIRGNFAVGDTVSIMDINGKEFARGLANYSSTELSKIKGQKSDQIAEILGYKYYDEAIHRDHLVIL
ncbi:MAG: glutamate 5-kinase [Candidatus Omnitrophica bacterium]|nr:glutamate 5-kinase [Candidatus Omnitrophota bacterium]